jgi:hypothetical protein
MNAKVTELSNQELLESATDDMQQYLENMTDSARQVNKDAADRLSAKIDSLRSQLHDLQNNNGRIDSLSENSTGTKRKLDSLQRKVSQILVADQLNSSMTGRSGELTEKLQGLPELKQLKLPTLNTPNTSLINGNHLEKYTSGMNDRISQFGGVDKVKNLIPGKFKNLNSVIPGEYKHYGDMVKDPSKIDGAIDQKAAQTDAFQELSKQQGALPGMNDLPKDMIKDLEKYQNYDNIKSQAKDLAVNQAKDFFKGHEDKLNGAMSKMAKLKKKYSYVPDSRDLSTAVKRNSLKGQPLRDRLVIGGNFQVLRGNPLSLDLSPYVLYKFNKVFFAGGGGTFRASLGDENNLHAQIVQNVYGVNALARHTLYKGFFGYGEFTYMSRPVNRQQSTTDTPQSAWTEGLLIGIGKKITLSKLFNGTIIFTYDVLHNDSSVNPKAWNLRFGFELGKMSLRHRRGFAKGSGL